MNNEFSSMMKEMVQTMMMEMMKDTMKEMMSEMVKKPEISPATATDTIKKAPKTMSKEEFMALAEKDDDIATPIELDFIVFGSKTAKYNKPVKSDIWIINHLAITKNYGGKWSKKNGGYIFDTPYELRAFLSSYQIKTVLSAEDKKAVEEYNKERAAKRAAYYANLAK